ncbi:HD-GYP domain-containing protein [Nitrosomonas aestuarii]|nr:HD-GYP domain-containing protein [Nitrosomonas aestuarii]
MQYSNSIFKIRVRDLRFGMYVSQLDRPWLETPYAIQGISIKTMEDILALERYCVFVYVDLNKSDPHIVKKYSPGASGAVKIQETAKVAKGIYQTPRAVTEKTPFHGGQVYADTRTVEEELPVANQVHHIALDVIKEIKTNFERSDTLEVRDARNAVYAMSDSIVRNPDAMLLLAQLKSSGELLYDSAVNNSILLLAFGRHLGLPRAELSLLGLGGLLMDVGKLRIPLEIVTTTDFLGLEELNLLKKHVRYGEEIIKQSGDIPATVFDIVSQHHEREDGSGYPRGLNANQLNTYARMAAIVDSYQELARLQPHSPATRTFQIFNQLKELSRCGLNATLVEQFAHCVGVFPVGSLVELNTGEVAIVLTHSRSKRALPSVMVVLDANKQPHETPETRDLKLLLPGPDGAPYTITQDLPCGAYGVDVKKYYL